MLWIVNYKVGTVEVDLEYAQSFYRLLQQAHGSGHICTIHSNISMILKYEEIKYKKQKESVYILHKFLFYTVD